MAAPKPNHRTPGKELIVHAYIVGQPYHPSRKTWPQISQFNYRGGELELILFFDRPSPAEVAAVKQSPAEFGIYHEHDQIVLCYRFNPGVPWSDAPYSYHLVPEPERVPPPSPDQLGPDARAILSILLVNATGGEVLALRAVSLSPVFTRALFAAIGAQAQLPWDSADYDRRVADVYARYPTSDALIAACSERTIGGA
jgi:hypothetical protein